MGGNKPRRENRRGRRTLEVIHTSRVGDRLVSGELEVRPTVKRATPSVTFVSKPILLDLSPDRSMIAIIFRAARPPGGGME
jgi:hypothetical protein